MRRDKIEAIKKLSYIKKIDRGNVKQIVEIQDTVNCTGKEAETAFRELDVNGRQGLLWVISTACGYDTLQFWLEHAILVPARIRDMEQAWDVVERQNESAWQKIQDASTELTTRLKDVADRENQVQAKEKELARRAIQMERDAGEEIRKLRQQIARLQAKLEREKDRARKGRMIEKLLA